MPSGGLQWMPDWSVLPLDLLVLISEYFTTFVDFIRFRSVCSSWRSAASPRSLPPSLPFLAIRPVDPDDSSPSCYFISPFEAKFVEQCLPNSCRNKHFMGSANGWLVMRGKDPFISDVSLLNPFTGAEIHLPPLYPHHFALTHNEFVLKIVVSSPVSAGQISAFAILRCSMKLALTRPGADEWTLFSSIPNNQKFQDALFFGGRFLVVDSFRRVFACEVDESSGPRLVEVMRYVPPQRSPFLHMEKCYLVDSVGELMMVIRRFDDAYVVKTTGFEVFKFVEQCLPNSCRNKRFIGSANGWLVMRGKDQFISAASLLNPFTGAEIHLPLLPHYFGGTHNDFVLKIVVSSPVSAGQISAFAILRCSMKLALTRPGADEWTLFSSIPNNQEFQDALFFGGRFLVVHSFKRVFACEVDESSGPRLVEVMRYVPPQRSPSQRMEKCYLVDSVGELMMVIRRFDDAYVVKTSGFEVFKVDPNHPNQWIEVSSLGDRSLFVGLNRSISICAREHPGCIENCIYFAHDAFRQSWYLPAHKFDIGVFNLGNTSIDFFLNCHSKMRYYFSHQSLWFSSLWFSPSLLFCCEDLV
ncbi:hypothetical protein M5K25_007479 [Dendrobium thyrsiflorum]|uniref:KIB1-4 beta-propeller domain-containing protein n=1 Tax=Dendrobium thyrsiflorum TaxID=117978 RepID=A0ABD0VFA9_DENTH